MNCTRLATIELGAYNLYGKIGTEKWRIIWSCVRNLVFLCAKSNCYS